ncbi:hypothetical protein MHBO_002895 [Bonamia ostreae]|uniref:RRM domain-containing protein n=1 Tax=Bonamia ostreae TaxID=126728 RepID=A0ABV2ANW8_9EUKA
MSAIPTQVKNLQFRAKIFKSVFVAFTVLSDPSKKRAYDAKLKMAKERQQRLSKETRQMRQMREKLEKREREAEKSQKFETETEIAKKKIEKEIERIRNKLRNDDKNEKLKSNKPLEADKILKVEFRKPETKENLKLIFNHYGKIDKLILKTRTAMICYKSKESVKKALDDEELNDFDLKVTSLQTNKKKREHKTDNLSKFCLLRDPQLSFTEYENFVIDLLSKTK